MEHMAQSAGGAFDGGAGDAERFAAAWDDSVMDTARVRDSYAYAAENPCVRARAAVVVGDTRTRTARECVRTLRSHAARACSFAGLADAFARGLELYRAGRLAEAVLAFEAVVRAAPDHSEAWRMLGLCHAESDEDVKAIMCFERAVEHDP